MNYVSGIYIFTDPISMKTFLIEFNLNFINIGWKMINVVWPAPQSESFQTYQISSAGMRGLTEKSAGIQELILYCWSRETPQCHTFSMAEPYLHINLIWLTMFGSVAIEQADCILFGWLGVGAHYFGENAVKWYHSPAMRDRMMHF